MHVFDPLDQTLPEVTEVRELSCRLAVSLSAWPGNGWGDALAFIGPGNGYAGRDAAGVVTIGYGWITLTIIGGN